MRRALACAALAAGTVAATMALGAPAYADTIEVLPGQSIQAAVNRAHPGDIIIVKPGVYHDSVLIKKDGIQVRGAGASKTGAVLEPPAGKVNRCLHGGAGFCVFASKTSTGFVPTSNVRISGFLIQGFSQFGIVGFGEKHLIAEHNVTRNNGAYGITAFSSTGSVFQYNTASGSGEAGFYIGDSPNADATIVGNDSFGNGATGFLFRDAANGTAADNTSHDNCSGFILLNTPAPTSPDGWELDHNQVFHNNRKCPGGEGPPPISGTGIALVGASNNTLLRNTVWANHPSEQAPFAGGIVLTSAPFPHNKVVPSNDNTLKTNELYKNLPFDLRNDPNSHGNTFLKNRCNTSQPDGLCT